MLLLRVQSRFMENVPSLEVEVAYALPNEQFLGRVTVPVGSTVHDAIRASGVLIQFPSIDIETSAVGIFSKRVALDHPLSPGDRVEIYRTLTITPVEARRLRALEKERKRKSG